MKGSIDDSDLGNMGQYRFTSSDSLEIGRVVEWCIIDAASHLLDHFFTDEHRLLEHFAAMKGEEEKP